MNMHTTITAEHPLVRRMAASREAANRRFWQLHAELEALEAEWAKIPDGSPEREAFFDEAVDAKFDEVMLQGVSCPSAILAKLKLVQFDAGGFALPAPAHTAARMIEWDLERCANADLLD